MFLSNALDTVIAMQGHECTLSDADNTNSVTLKMAKSNMDRMRKAVDNVAYDGTEFVTTIDQLNGFVPKRGDLIESTLLGDFTITMVVEQIALGSIIGYRLRC